MQEGAAPGCEYQEMGHRWVPSSRFATAMVDGENFLCRGWVWLESVDNTGTWCRIRRNTEPSPVWIRLRKAILIARFLALIDLVLILTLEERACFSVVSHPDVELWQWVFSFTGRYFFFTLISAVFVIFALSELIINGNLSWT